MVAYGISINLVEVTWKSKIKAQFPNPNDYSSFMGDFSTATGAVTFTMMIVSRFIFNKFGWGMAALITPTVLLLTGAAGGPGGGRAGAGAAKQRGAAAGLWRRFASCTGFLHGQSRRSQFDPNRAALKHTPLLTPPSSPSAPPHLHRPLPAPSPALPRAGVIFFSLVLFSGPLTPSLAAMGLTPLYAAVLVGAAQNIFSKASKYSLFDPCKEMAYIPLDQETRVGGRAGAGRERGRRAGERGGRGRAWVVVRG